MYVTCYGKTQHLVAKIKIELLLSLDKVKNFLLNETLFKEIGWNLTKLWLFYLFHPPTVNIKIMPLKLSLIIQISHTNHAHIHSIATAITRLATDLKFHRHNGHISDCNFCKNDEVWVIFNKVMVIQKTIKNKRISMVPVTGHACLKYKINQSISIRNTKSINQVSHNTLYQH